MLDGDRAADEARLRLPPEQPDRHRQRREPSCSRSSTGFRSTSSAFSTRRTSSTSTTRTTPTGIELFREGRRHRGAADVLEDLRPRRAARRLGGRAAPTSSRRRSKVRRAFDVTATAQAAALASLDDAQEIARRRELNATGRDRLAEILRDHGLEPVEAGARQLPLRRRRRRAGAVRATAARRRDRPAARRLRRAGGDPRQRRHAGGERVLRGRVGTRPFGRLVTGRHGGTFGRRLVSTFVRPARAAPAAGVPQPLLRDARLERRARSWPRSRSRSTSRSGRTRRTPVSGSAPCSSSSSCRRSSSGSCSGRSSTGCERRSLMIAADALRVGVFAALPFAPSAGDVVALAFVAGLATGFFRPAVYAGVPNLVERRRSCRRRTRSSRRSRTSAG